MYCLPSVLQCAREGCCHQIKFGAFLKLAHNLLSRSSRRIIGQGVAEALTDQQSQRGLLFVQGRKQRTSLAGATEQHSHIVHSLLISLKVKRKAEDYCAGKARHSFTLTAISQKSQRTKKIMHTHTEGKCYPTPSNACSIP